MGSLVLAACFISLAPSARSIAQGCAEAPGSPLVINVKDQGAKGDGRTNDTAAIQLVIDEIAGTGGTVFVPNGTYMIEAVGEKRLTLKSDMTLKLSKGATLKAIPNNSEHYSVLAISGVSNVTVVGGTLEGERKEHRGKSGEWGMGIFIDRGAKHITISGVTSKNMWGDGFYVQGATDVKFCSVSPPSTAAMLKAQILELDRRIMAWHRFNQPWDRSANMQGTPEDPGTSQLLRLRVSRITRASRAAINASTSQSTPSYSSSALPYVLPDSHQSSSFAE